MSGCLSHSSAAPYFQVPLKAMGTDRTPRDSVIHSACAFSAPTYVGQHTARQDNDERRDGRRVRPAGEERETGLAYRALEAQKWMGEERVVGTLFDPHVHGMTMAGGPAAASGSLGTGAAHNCSRGLDLENGSKT